MKKILSFLFVFILLFGCIDMLEKPYTIKLEGDSFQRQDNATIKTRVSFLDFSKNCHIGNGTLNYYLLDGLGRRITEKEVKFSENEFKVVSNCSYIHTELKYDTMADYLQVEGEINGNKLSGVKVKFEFEMVEK
ncbi:MAG: hypothetical protein WC501_03230 [Candidatus Micrarchaeia archaeon]|jgi:hypothetical protein